MRNKDFDGFAEAKLTAEHQELFESIRRLVEETVPSAHEVMSSGAPAWQGKRILAVVSTGPSHLAVTFERGASFNDEHGLLEGTGFTKRYIKIATPDAVPEDAIRDYLSQAAALDDPDAAHS